MGKIRTTRRAVFGGRNRPPARPQTPRPGTYDQRSVYDDRSKPSPSPYVDQTDIEDIKARENNPEYDNSKARAKREKLAGKLRDTAGKLQDAEDNPIMYTGKDGKQRESKWNGIRKKGILIGGVGGAGLFGGLGLFTTTLGPAQLINMSEVLSHYHMGPQEEDTNTSTWRLMKYAYWFNKGQAERTRLGFIRNGMADRYEVYLNSVGLTSKYTRAGFFDGLVVDNTYPKYRGMSDTQIIQSLASESVIGTKSAEVRNSRIPNGKVVITTKEMSKMKARKYIAAKMREGGASGWSAWIGSRIMNKRNGAISSLFHPIKKMDDKLLKGAEKVVTKAISDDFKKRLLEKVKTKKSQVSTSIKENKDAPEGQKRNAETIQNDANNIINEGNDAANKAAAGDAEAVGKFTESLTAKRLKFGASVGGILSLPCILDAIVNGYSQLKQDLIVLPLMNNALLQMAAGQQAQGSVDVSLAQLGPWSDRLVSTDKSGKQTSGWDADSMTAIEGRQNKGQPPNETLTTIMGGTPFDFVKAEPFKTSLSVICSSEAQGLLLAVSFITGPIQTLVGAVSSSVVLEKAIPAASKYLSNNPFNPLDTGPDQVNDLNYGMRLVSLQNGLAHGGVPLSAGEARQAQQNTLKAQTEEFQSKSLAYRLFNPHDYRTPVAQWIDHQTTNDVMSNVASAFTGIMNITSNFGSTLLGAFTGKSSAIAGDYAFSGIPTAGIPPEVMADPRYENTAEMDGKAADLFESSNGSKYIERAKKCMGVTIARDSTNRWAVTSEQESSPKVEDATAAECSEKSDAWKITYMWVNYTTDADSDACWRGGIVQSCVNAGLGGGGASSGSGDTSLPTGDAKKLADELLALYPNKVNFQNKAIENQFREIAASGTQKACNGKKVVPINPDMLAVLLKATEKYSIYIGVLAAGHDCDSGQHPLGNAVDLNGVAKDGISTGTQLHIQELNAQQTEMVRGFYDYIGSIMPAGKGGMGQVQCFAKPPPQHHPPVFYFADECSHLHIDVRQN